MKHFDFDSMINGIKKGDMVLFLYTPLSNGNEKLSANGVIGKFHSFEYSYMPDKSDHQGDVSLESAMITINLEISNKGIIGLSISDMAYFEKWYRGKLELVI